MVTGRQGNCSNAWILGKHFPIYFTTGRSRNQTRYLNNFFSGHSKYRTLTPSRATRMSGMLVLVFFVIATPTSHL